MNAYLLLPLIQTLFSLVLIAVVLKGHSKSFTHRLFAILLLFMAMWGIVILGMRASPDVEHAYSWEKWLIPLGPFTTVLFYHFSVRYTATRIKEWLIPLFYGFCILSIPLVATTNLLVRGMQIKPYGYAPILGPMLPLWLLFSYLLLIMALVNFVRASITSPYAEQRNRAAYITAGIGFLLVGVVCDALPLLGLPLYPGLIIGNIVFCLLVTVAIVRYNLLDIRVVLRKGTAYVLMSALIAIPFVGIFLLVTQVFTEGDFPSWAYFVLIIVLALVLRPLWSQVQSRVDRWFDRERYDYLKALETFSQQSQSITDSAKLGSTMVNLIAKALRSSNVYLLQPLPRSRDFSTAFFADVNNSTPAIRLKRQGALVKWLERSNSMLSHEDIEIIPQLQSVTSKEKQILQQVGAELIVPLKALTGQLSGVLILGKKLSEQPYTVEDKQLIYTICNQMSTNLENVRLYGVSQQEVAERKQAEEELRQSHEQLRNLSTHIESATETERTSMAREVHDELGQALTALKMDLSWLNKRLPKEQEALIKKTGEMLRLIGSTIQTVKRISTKLRPGVLDDLGLIAAIEWQVQEFQERARIKCELIAEGEDINLDRDLATGVFRILQEALTNVARHANATRVKVSLEERDEQLVLEVRDNGKGITGKQIAHPRSFGLIGMRERARSWNGSVKIGGIPGKGTVVTVNIPLNRREERNDKNTSRR